MVTRGRNGPDNSHGQGIWPLDIKDDAWWRLETNFDHWVRHTSMLYFAVQHAVQCRCVDVLTHTEVAVVVRGLFFSSLALSLPLPLLGWVAIL